MDLYNETISLMKKYGIYAKKGLGQNFLIDSTVIDSVISHSNIYKDDLIIEIGPGLGTLTAQMLDSAAKLACIELDIQMINILKDRFKDCSNLVLINDDVLKVDLASIIRKYKGSGQVKVIANLPYYITTPIIMKLLESKLDIDDITVMVQKEVADRLIEEPGGKNCGAITYAVNYYSIPSSIVDVSKDSFYPVPKVDSKVINLHLRNEAPVKVKNEELFFKIIKAAFLQRRKTLVNCLVNGNIFKSKEEANLVLEEMGLDIRVRGEDLSLGQYAYICNRVYGVY